MAIIFTICSNNYLAQASLLGYAVQRHLKGVNFFCLLVDEYNEAIHYQALPFITIPIATIEPAIDTLADKYNIVELNACLKPFGFKYFFENYAENRIIFLDPDMLVYDSLELFDSLFASADILLTPHILSPIPMDGKTPSENTFLNYGLYNAGFIGVQRSEESIRCINWWKERTYENGFDRVNDGLFADQLYLNLIPVFFRNVLIIEDMGCNMAPWNLHERYLTKHGDGYKVNDNYTLKFFHFGSFLLNSFELPVHFYNRFLLKDRDDLREIYADYNESLAAAGYVFYRTIDCVYYERYIDKNMALIEAAEEEKWNRKSLLKKLFFRTVPKSLFRLILAKVQSIVNEYPYSSFEGISKRW